MSNLLDYLSWRGELSLSQAPFSPVDSLILSTLAYVHFDQLIPNGFDRTVPMGAAAAAFLALPENERGRIRCDTDLKLLKKLSQAPRFASMGLTFNCERFVPEQETQFAAMTVLPGDGSAFLSFRGTDSTLVGWKEDFNMSFLAAVPAQWAALEYTELAAAAFPGPLRLGGHSKGGNLAIFAASQCPADIRSRITDVYNHDGPGFTPVFLGSPGYRELLPRIHTFVPQSSIIGMLLEHEEPYTVIQSDEVGLLQHDPYSWEVEGKDFIRLEDVTPGSKITDRVIKGWIAGMTPERRGQFVDVLYDLLSSGKAGSTPDTQDLPSLSTAIHALKDTDEASRHTLVDTLLQLIRSAVEVAREEHRTPRS